MAQEGGSETQGLGSQAAASTSLVRNFGYWQDRALVEPVHIQHRGRVRLALVSIEYLNDLRRTAWPENSATRLTTLLDSLREPVLVLDEEGRIETANRAASAYFRLGSQTAGREFEQIVGADVRDFVHQALSRVRRSGIIEQIELRSGDEGTHRTLKLEIVPLTDGVGIAGQDCSITSELNDVRAAYTAVDDALTVLEDAAKVRVNLRGYIVVPTHSLALMTHLSPEALAQVRFSSLFSPSTRVAVTEALEQIVETGSPLRVEAELLRHGVESLKVSLGLSLLRVGHHVEAVQAILINRVELH